MSLNAQQNYAYNQSNGAVTLPVNSSYVQAYAEYLGITQPTNGSWIQAICEYFGIMQPLYGSWVIALAHHYNITEPLNGSWWYALSQVGAPQPPVILPIANFTSDVTTVTENSSVLFEDTSTVPVGGLPITAWLWTLPGGTPSTSTEQNPTIQYNTPGSYSVTLEVTNGDGSNTKTVPDYITVEETPVTQKSWLTSGLQSIFSIPITSGNKYFTSGLNTNFK